MKAVSQGWLHKYPLTVRHKKATPPSFDIVSDLILVDLFQPTSVSHAKSPCRAAR